MALGPLGNKVSVFVYVLYLFIVGFFEFNEKTDILCQGLFGGVVIVILRFLSKAENSVQTGNSYC